MSVISAIHDNFRQLMDTTIVGLTSGSFKEYKGRLDIKDWNSVPPSVRDRAYTILFNGMVNSSDYISPDCDITYGINLQLSFALSKADLGIRKDNALHDIETILVKRLDPFSWSGYQDTLVGLEHLSTTPFLFVNDNEKFAVVQLEFKVIGRARVN